MTSGTPSSREANGLVTAFTPQSGGGGVRSPQLCPTPQSREAGFLTPPDPLARFRISAVGQRSASGAGTHA